MTKCCRTPAGLDLSPPEGEQRILALSLEHSRPVLSPPATPEDPLEVQPQSRVFSAAALDGGEHRAIIVSGDGGNGCSSSVGKLRELREKSPNGGRDEG
jgi:hypothetical protein